MSHRAAPMPHPAPTATPPVFTMVHRVAGLTTADIQGSDFPQTRAVLRRCQAMEADHQRATAALCADLADVIARYPPSPTRDGLASLRRAIYDNHPLKPLHHAAIAPEQFPPSLRHAVLAWERARIEYAALFQSAEQALCADEAQCEQVMKDLFAGSALRSGVFFSRPDFFQRISQHFAKPTKGKPSKDRKLITTLLSYARRAVFKTSPMGSFTSSGVGNAQGDEAHGVHSPTAEALTIALARQFQPVLPLRLTPTFAVQHSGEMTALVQRHDGTPPSLVSLSPSPHALLLCQLVHRFPGQLTAAAAIERAMALLQTQDPRPFKQPLEQLLAIGILEPQHPCSIFAPDFLSQWGQAIAQAAPQAAEELRQGQQAFDALRTGQSHVVNPQALSCLSERYGLPVPKAWVHHDAPRPQDSTPAPALSEQTRTALDLLCGVLPLFCLQTARQRALTRHFTRRFGQGGRCPDWAAFLAECDETSLAEPDYQQTQDRTDFLAALRQKSFGQQKPVPLTAQDLQPWIERATLYRPRGVEPSVGLVGHVIEEDQGQHFVLNQVVPGYGALLARHLDPARAEHLRASLAQAMAPAPTHPQAEREAVELIAPFGFWGQRHPPLTRRVVRCPGVAAVASSQHEIPWSDLSLDHDPQHDCLVLRETTTQRQIMPFHFGTLSSHLLPPLYQRLLLLGPAYAPSLPLLDWLEETGAPDDHQPRRYAALTIAGVTIMRQSWSFPLSALPTPRKGESEFSAFHRLAAWAAEQGLPQRVYLTPMQTSQAMALHQQQPGQRLGRLRKPLWIDWEDLGSHRILARYLHPETSRITITQALPDRLSPPAPQTEPLREVLFEMGISL